jgi:hypothetical protein
MNNAATASITLEENLPTAEAKVTVGGKLLCTGEAWIDADRSGGWFLPTDNGKAEIPPEGARLTMWGTDDAVPMLYVIRRIANGRRAYRFALTLNR